MKEGVWDEQVNSTYIAEDTCNTVIKRITEMCWVWRKRQSVVRQVKEKGWSVFKNGWGQNETWLIVVVIEEVQMLTIKVRLFLFLFVNTNKSMAKDWEDCEWVHNDRGNLSDRLISLRFESHNYTMYTKWWIVCWAEERSCRELCIFCAVILSVFRVNA